MKVSVGQGLFAEIDECDLTRVSQHSWWIQKSKNKTIEYNQLALIHHGEFARLNEGVGY